MVKKSIIVFLILLGIFACGMIQQASNRTYEMETIYTPTASYVVVMDTRTSLVRVKEVTQCDNERFFDEDEARLQRYEHDKRLKIVR